MCSGVQIRPPLGREAPQAGGAGPGIRAAAAHGALDRISMLATSGGCAAGVKQKCSRLHIKPHISSAHIPARAVSTSVTRSFHLARMAVLPASHPGPTGLTTDCSRRSVFLSVAVDRIAQRLHGPCSGVGRRALRKHVTLVCNEPHVWALVASGSQQSAVWTGATVHTCWWPAQLQRGKRREQAQKLRAAVGQWRAVQAKHGERSQAVQHPQHRPAMWAGCSRGAVGRGGAALAPEIHVPLPARSPAWGA